MFKKIVLRVMVLTLSCVLYKVEKVEAKQKALICDLGGIFFDLNTSGFIEAVGDGSTVRGVLNVLQYAVRDFKNPFKAIEDKFFETLDQFPLKAEEGFKAACKSSGKRLPYALCAYQAGRITSKDLLPAAEQVCDRLHDKKDFFASEREEQIIRNVLKGTFNPEVHAKYTYPLTNALELLNEVASQVNEDGTKKYIIEGLSNWDRESFAFVHKNFEKEFSYFDDIVISGNIGTVKPNNGAFEFVLNKLAQQGFTKEDCMFIDDQKENVDAAHALGIRAVLVKRGDAQSLAAALKELGILQEVPAKSFFVAHKSALLFSGLAVGGLSLAYAYGRPLL